MNIYHITSRKAWIDATRSGAYSAPSLASEGFIHCSSATQVLPVAMQFYFGQTGLVLLAIDPRRLKSGVRWEAAVPPKGPPQKETFPHVYGPIQVEAVIETWDFEPNAAGGFTLPLSVSEEAAGHRT